MLFVALNVIYQSITPSSIGFSAYFSLSLLDRGGHLLGVRLPIFCPKDIFFDSITNPFDKLRMSQPKRGDKK